MEDFTIDQDWSYGELLAHRKENVFDASQIGTHIMLKTFAHLAAPFKKNYTKFMLAF